MSVRRWRLLGALLASGWLQLGISAHAQEVPGCGSLKSGYGPFDYRTGKASLRIVEQYHFPPSVEQLRKGISGTIGGDLAYTLHASPNHHRALMSMVNLGVRDRTAHAPGAAHSVECYLIRAETYTPDDGMVKLIYGLYFLKHGQPQQALAKLEEASALDGNDANIHYNLGLAYFDLKQYDKSLAGAHRAYALGFPLPGLRDKLKRAGKWREPPPPAPETISPEPAASGVESAPPAATGQVGELAQ